MLNISVNRRLLSITGIGGAIALTICGGGIQLLPIPWFSNIVFSPWGMWLAILLGLMSFLGTPILLTLLVWRWESFSKGWMGVVMRWLLGCIAILLGWLLTEAAGTLGLWRDLPSFIKDMLSTSGTYYVISGGSALIGFLDWFFFTRHWGKKALTTPK